MVEKLAVNTKHNRSMKSNKKGGRGSMSNRHAKNAKVQNNFSFGGSNSLNWRNEGTKNSVSESNNYGYNNHYVANAFYSLIGLQVEIQKKDGNIHEGILETVSSKVEFHLSHACEKTNSKQDGLTKSEKMCKKLIFPFCDVVYCKALSVDIDFAKRDTLLTDSAISGTTNGSFNERELVQWQPEDNAETITSELGEHDPNSGWAFDEMMRVNEEEHGVKSTFDSSMSSYMTPLEKGDEEEYRAREKRAEQAAREIQKEPKFKEVDNIDSSMGEEELFSSVSRTTPNNNSNNYNANSNTPINNSNNNTITNSNSNSPNSNDGFTTYTGKNYRTGRHTTTPAASVVGPRLQRNNLRNHEGQNHTSTGNHQVNRNHISSPQRSQTGSNNSTSRNNSYQHQQTSTQGKHQQQQPPPYPRVDHHKASVPSHQLQENIPPPMANNRTQCDPVAANSTRTTLSYSAVAMKKDPISNNNRVHAVPKPVIPLQPIVLQDVIQPVAQQAETSTPPLPPQPHDQPPPSIPNTNMSPTPSPSVPVEQVVPAEKATQPAPAWAPEALAAAKQQMIIDARKKANMGQVEPHVTTASLLPATPATITTTTISSSEVTSSVITSSTITSPTRQQPQAQVNQNTPRPALVQQSVTSTARPHGHNVEVAEKASHRPAPVKVDSLEKNPTNVEMKCETTVAAASVSPKEQRSRGEDSKQPFLLMKFGRIQNVAEEKKGSSYKELKDFGEQFKLEAKPKKRQAPKSTELTPKATPEVPIKAPDIPVEIKSEEPEPVQDVADASKSDTRTALNTDVVTTSSYTSSHSSPHLIITTVVATSSVTVVSSFTSAVTTLATTTTTTAIPSNDEPTSPSRKSSLNPAAKEFNLNPSAKEFNPVKENIAPPFTPSPKQSPARQTSSSTPVPHTPVQHQPYYHSQAVMIHSNGPEVISPTVQSVPLKQIYARPYISPGPGGSTVYSIPAVQFANNNNNGGPQLIAAPQSGFISAQNATGQQMIIIHGPNDTYQHVVQAGQGQQYYSMQQMIRCVPGHPASNTVQQAAARVPGNFQQQDGSPGGYVIAVSQHGGLVQHPSVPGNQHQGYHPPQSPVQSSHIQTQYAITHASPSTYLQNPQSPAQITYTQGNNGPAFRSPSSIHSVTGQHHPQQPFVMVTHQGQHVQTVAVPNNQTYVQGQQYGGGILQNYQSGN